MKKYNVEDANLENIKVDYYGEEETLLLLTDKKSGKKVAGVYGDPNDHDIEIGDWTLNKLSLNIFDTIDSILSYIVMDHSSLSNSQKSKLRSVFHKSIESNMILDYTSEDYISCNDPEEYINDDDDIECFYRIEDPEADADFYFVPW